MNASREQGLRLAEAGKETASFHWKYYGLILFVKICTYVTLIGVNSIENK